MSQAYMPSTENLNVARELVDGSTDYVSRKFCATLGVCNVTVSVRVAISYEKLSEIIDDVNQIDSRLCLQIFSESFSNKSRIRLKTSVETKAHIT